MAAHITYCDFVPFPTMNAYAEKVLDQINESAPSDAVSYIRMSKDGTGYVAEVEICSEFLRSHRSAFAKNFYAAIDRAAADVDLDIHEWRAIRTKGIEL